jgi:SAM-dependent methyltransferase
VSQALRDTPLGGSGHLVDVGCGTGDNIGALVDASGCAAVGTDLSLYALNHAPRSASGASLVSMAFGEALPFPSASADVLTCMDVIEHVDDDELVLREFGRVLRPGGVVLLTTSAYMWMWSEHDVWAAHRRRYTARGLADVTTRAGFEVLRTTYYNSVLLAPAWLLRRTPLHRLVKTSNDEVGASSPLVDRVFTAVSSAERRWVARHRMPFGLSILLVARRAS